MDDWARKILSGDIRALARAATAVENGDAQAAALMRDLASLPKRARVIGITGPPGAGKSTLVDRIARALRGENRTVGIIAVDPSSAVSGGAILGDRVRMQAHHADPGIFIRSMATRGSLGGLAGATAKLVRLLDAAGKDFILVETVGVGQAEVEVARLTDATVVVLVPGMGDGVQAIKAGVLEIADVFAINKADHPGAGELVQDLHAAGWTSPAIQTIATEGVGVDELVAAIGKVERGRQEARRGQFALDHLGVAVRSIDEALRFYEGQLGMSVSLREEVPHEKVKVAMLPMGGPRLELLEPADPESVIGRFLDKRGPGLHHVALRVANLSTAVARLKETGARLIGEPKIGAGGHRYVFVHPGSTGGVLLELIEEKEI
ncbi:MAG: methylmalonyl Co-A mutase-associated GTPase MeaB [Bryobacteraceae bacterium]